MYSEVADKYKLVLKDRDRLDMAEEIHSLALEAADEEEWRNGLKGTANSRFLLLLVIEILVWEFSSMPRLRSVHQRQLINRFRSALVLLLPPLPGGRGENSQMIFDREARENHQNQSKNIKDDFAKCSYLKTWADERGESDSMCDASVNLEDAAENLIAAIIGDSMELEGIKMITLVLSHLPKLNLNDSLGSSLVRSIRMVLGGQHDRSQLLIVNAAIQLFILLFEGGSLFWLHQKDGLLVELLEEVVVLLPFTPVLAVRLAAILVRETQWALPVTPRILKAMVQAFEMLMGAIGKSNVAFSAIAHMLTDLIRPLWSNHLTGEPRHQLTAMAFELLASRHETSPALHRLVATLLSLEITEWCVAECASNNGLISKHSQTVSLKFLDLESETGLRILLDAVNGVNDGLRSKWTALDVKLPPPTAELLRRNGVLPFYIALASRWRQLTPALPAIISLLSWAEDRDSWRAIAHHLLSVSNGHFNLESHENVTQLGWQSPPQTIESEQNTHTDTQFVKKTIDVISRNSSPVDIWLVLELAIHFETDIEFIRRLNHLNSLSRFVFPDQELDPACVEDQKISHEHVVLQWLYARSVKTSEASFRPLLISPYDGPLAVVSPSRVTLLRERLGKETDPLISLFTDPSSCAMSHFQGEVSAMESGTRTKTVSLSHQKFDIPMLDASLKDQKVPSDMSLACIRVGLAAKMLLDTDPTHLPAILDVLLSLFEQKDTCKMFMEEIIEHWILETVLFDALHTNNKSLTPAPSASASSNSPTSVPPMSVALALEVRTWIQTQNKRRSSIPHPRSMSGLELRLSRHTGTISENSHFIRDLRLDVYLDTSHQCTEIENTSDVFDGYSRWIMCRALAVAGPHAWISELQSSLRAMVPISRLQIPLFHVGDTNIIDGDNELSSYVSLEGIASPWSDTICLRQLLSVHGDIGFWLRRAEGERQFGAFMAMLLWDSKWRASLLKNTSISNDRDLMRHLLISSLDATIAVLLLLAGNMTTIEMKETSVSTTVDDGRLRTALGQLVRAVALDSPEALFTTSTTRCWRVLWILLSGRHHPLVEAIAMLNLDLENWPRLQSAALNAFTTLDPAFTAHALPQLLLKTAPLDPLVGEISSTIAGEPFSVLRLILSAFLMGVTQSLRLSAPTIDIVVEETRMALLEAIPELSSDDAAKANHYLACFRGARRTRKSSGTIADLADKISQVLLPGPSWICTLISASGAQFLVHALRAAICTSSDKYEYQNIDSLLTGEDPLDSIADRKSYNSANDVPKSELGNGFGFLLVQLLVHRWPELVTMHLADAPSSVKLTIGRILIKLELSRRRLTAGGTVSAISQTASDSYQPLLQMALHQSQTSMGWKPAEALFLLLSSRETDPIDMAEFLCIEEALLMKMPELLGNDILASHLMATESRHGGPPSHLLTNWRMSEVVPEHMETYIPSIQTSLASGLPVVASSCALERSLSDAHHAWRQGHASWAIALLQHDLGSCKHLEVKRDLHPLPSQKQKPQMGSTRLFDSASASLTHIEAILTLTRWTAEARAAGPATIDRLYRRAEAAYYEAGGPPPFYRPLSEDIALSHAKKDAMKDAAPFTKDVFYSLGALAGAPLYSAWGLWADDMARKTKDMSLIATALRAYAGSLSLQSRNIDTPVRENANLDSNGHNRHFTNALLLTLRVAHLWFREGDRVDVYIRQWFGDDGIVTPDIWLVLVHQLAARLGAKSASKSSENDLLNLFERDAADNQSSKPALVHIYKRMAIAHPFLALYPLFYVLGGPTKAETGGASSGGAAAQLMVELAAGPIAAELRAAIQLAEASVELGVRLPPTGSGSNFSLDSSWYAVRISRSGGLAAPVLTATSKTPTTDKWPLVVGWAERGRVLNGINAPKALDCYGSDGRSYPQLFKARDDLRQDALVLQVMQCLGDASDASRRGGGISTQLYPVIPLQKFVGVIGMLSDTLVLGDWLVDAHRRLRPKDMRPEQATRLMADTFRRNGSKKAELPRSGANLTISGSTHDCADMLRSTFQTVRSSFAPVLRHFFWEANGCSWREGGAQGWLQARIAYSESVGVSSMLGWMVGLGDRHPQNILISRELGTLCHIDLNLIFDAGQQLKIPELVPFRLTPDICDGLLRPWRNEMTRPVRSASESSTISGSIHSAISGCKFFPSSSQVFLPDSDSKSTRFDDDLFLPLGIFGRVASKTLLALRSRSELICMLFEAFRHDPLYVQSRNSPADADKDLARLRERLASTSLLSAEAQVNALVREAIDERSLAAMYHGWQAWM